MRKASPETDQASRSLLQKAVRRGDWEMVHKTFSYIYYNEGLDWLRSRLAVMVTEECWSYIPEVSFDIDVDIILKHYYEITSSVKSRDASGLGAMSYAYLEKGQDLFLNFDVNLEIRTIRGAILKQIDFWNWIKEEANSKGDEVIKFVDNSHSCFKKSGWPWDRAFAQSAAFLRAINNFNPVRKITDLKIETPYWVGLDKHTNEGKLAMRKVAKRNGLDSNLLMWLSFYFESALVNELEYSIWWEKEIDWRMENLNIDRIKGFKIWSEIKGQVENELMEHSLLLEQRISSSRLIRFPKHLGTQTSFNLTFD
jgi:hypothetical protein